MVARLVAVALGMALGLATLELSRRDPGFSFARSSPAGTVVLLAAGWSVMGAAVLLPRRRIGVALVLYLTGCCWFVSQWGTPHTPAIVFTLGLLAVGVTPALATHSATGYGGPSRTSRLLAVAGYLVTVGLQGLATALWFRPEPAICDCPTNLVAVSDDPHWVAVLGRWGVWAGLAWALAVAALLEWRLLSRSRAWLRSAGAVTACGLAYAALTAAYHARGLQVGTLGSDPVDRQIWVAQGILLVLLGAAVAADLVRVRRARRALTGVVTGLAGTGADLRADLGARLGDPGLMIAYPVDAGTRHVDTQGRPVDLDATDGRVVTPIRRAGVPLAVVLHRPGIDLGEIEALASAVHLAMDHQRLDAEALVQLADLRASGARIVAAGDAERRRIERDLHDGAQQHLVSLKLQTELLRAGHPGDPGLTAASKALGTAARQLRSTARRLSSVLLDSAGLPAAIGALAETRSVTVTALPAGRLPEIIETTIYLLAERATRSGDLDLAIGVVDDTVTVVLRSATDPDLAEIADRVTTLDGTIERRTAGDGTTLVTVTLPTPPLGGTAIVAGGVCR